MAFVLTVVVSLFAFGLIIFVHELGHFLAAKWSGVKVNEFALGMGPKIWSFTKGETLYAVRAFPIGGFVAMEGEDGQDGEEQGEDARSYNNAPLYKRAIISVAGAVMNLLLGLIIVIIMTNAKTLLSTTIISGFEEDSRSALTGLMKDDIIKKINGQDVRIDNDIIFALVRVKDAKADFLVRRDGKDVLLRDVEFNSQTVDGTSVVSIDFHIYGTEKNFTKVALYSCYWSYSIAKTVWVSLTDILTGNFQFNQLSGPVGVTTALGGAARQGLPSFLLILAFITINIGVFNLLPFPALDGGKLVFLLAEGICRRKINPKIEAYINSAGFMLLILLMIAVTIGDVFKLVRK